MPSAAEAIAERIDRSMSKLDSATDAMRLDYARRDRERKRLDSMNEEIERGETNAQARRWADSCRKHQSRYDEVFHNGFGERAPARIADEAPGDYRRRMFDALRRKLPDKSDLHGIDPQELTSGQIGPFEEQLFAEAAKEGAVPSWDNLPPDNTLVAKHKRDDSTGLRTTTYYGRSSFIKDFSRPTQRVLSFNNSDGSVLWPPAAHAARLKASDLR
jgi:hypothetical protein